MTALNFPASPTEGQVYTANGSSWIWNGTVWVGGNVTPATAGGTGLTSSGAAGNVLTSDGTGWVSGAAPSGAVEYPQNVQNGNYTLVLDDAGKQIYSANTGAQIITIPTNASVAFPIRTVITIVNMGVSSIILSTTGVSVVANGVGAILNPSIIKTNNTIQLIKTSTNTWSSTFGTVMSPEMSYLMIAGGGGGGGYRGGGGGAGGLVSGIKNVTTGTLTITVGAGGAGGGAFDAGGVGGNTSVTGLTTAIGGGAGAGSGNATNSAGGSGGGTSGSNTVASAGTAGQGNAGGTSSSTYSSGGGGGAGAAGNVSGAGGAGLASSITGTSIFYAGGGGANGLAGGVGGGGLGGNTLAGTAGTANRGGGGGGGVTYSPYLGYAGGSGVVIIASDLPAASTTGSPIVTTSNGKTIYKFTTSGTITF